MLRDTISSTPTDGAVRQWMAEARDGSAESMGRLLETFQQYLVLIADRGLGPDLRGKLGGSDVVQETFLEAQRDFPQFQGTNSEELLAWLRRLLLNNLLNQKRHYRDMQCRAVSRELHWECAQAGAAPPVSKDNTPSQHAVCREEAALLNAALARLPQHYREVIELRDYHHLTFGEIGLRMGRTEDAARMLWARAFERLACELDRRS